MQPDYAEAAVSKYAGEHALGTSQSDGFDFYRGVNHRGQVLSQGIVHAKVGGWANLKEMTW